MNRNRENKMCGLNCGIIRIVENMGYVLGAFILLKYSPIIFMLILSISIAIYMEQEIKMFMMYVNSKGTETKNKFNKSKRNKNIEKVNLDNISDEDFIDEKDNV